MTALVPILLLAVVLIVAAIGKYSLRKSISGFQQPLPQMRGHCRAQCCYTPRTAVTKKIPNNATVLRTP
jgi:hypothetical protein